MKRIEGMIPVTSFILQFLADPRSPRKSAANILEDRCKEPKILIE